MSTLFWLLVAYLVDFAIQLPPALMPPSWALLAFFYIHFHLPLLPLAVGGAAASTMGRLVLAEGAGRLGRGVISAQRKTNLAHLGRWINQRPVWQVPLAVFAFAVGPIPSNYVFIAAGLTETRLAAVATGFFLGRVVSYTVLAEATKSAVPHVQTVFAQYFHSWTPFVAVLVVIAIVYALIRIDWIALLHIPAQSPDDGPLERDTLARDKTSSTREEETTRADE